MNKKTKGISSIILLQSFTVFPEYFVGISTLYVLIVIVIITHNIYGLMIQKALSECFALIMFMSCFLIYNDDLMTQNFVSFHYSIINDYLSYISKFLVCFFSTIYFLLISTSLKEQKLTSFEYLLIVLFAILGLMLMCSSNDFLTVYLSLELSSLAFYILASFKKTSSYSVESGLKYFITGAISSSFFLFGVSFIYVFSGSINFYDLFRLFGSLPTYPPCGEGAWRESYYTDWNFAERRFLQYIYITWWYSNCIYIHPDDDPHWTRLDCTFNDIGLAFIGFSLFTKLAAAPFHLWSLDVYEGSPTSSTFFFATISKFSIFILLIRIFYITFNEELRATHEWPHYFYFTGVFSIFVGSFGGLRQRKVKTLLAYSSITNVGYALIALGTNSFIGVQMFFFHIVTYLISGFCTWSILILLRLKTKKLGHKYSKELGDLALLRKSNPALAFAFSLTMFSIAGIPPMVGFLAKMGIFLSLVSFEIYLIVIPSAVFSVVSAFYYIRIIKVMCFENLLIGKLYKPIHTNNTLILSLLISSLLLLFINPNIIHIGSYLILPLDNLRYI